MIKQLIYYVALFVFSLFLGACSSKKKAQKILTSPSITVPVDTTSSPVVAPVKTKTAQVAPELIINDLPEVSREFRAAWVASVANINWPSKNNLTTAQQQQEALAILDYLKANNFNAVIFQVRPSSDALYHSELEPWSYFLTGVQGQAPSPYYDPLAYWVEQAHERGLELHVWLNPYRAHHTSGGPVTRTSMAKKMPESVVRLKQGWYWFDPSRQETQDHASAVVKDIVKRYDIDGVHFDDYFYPYAEYNGGQDFPDSESWNAYVKTGGTLSRADWRRHAVNTFVERVYKEIKAEKNHVKFGISPFGIWKPGYPQGVTGSSQYDMLYADAKLWLNKGWVDYYAPQLYWPIEPAKQSFTALLKWWQSENTQQRHLWPGINTVGKRTEAYTTEIVNQIAAMRNIVPQSPGIIHWSLAGLTKNPLMSKTIFEGPYQFQVLSPQTPWLTSFNLEKPAVQGRVENGQVAVKWTHSQLAQVFKWVVYTQYGGTWTYEILTKNTVTKEYPRTKDGKKLQHVVVLPVDRLDNLGKQGVYKL